MSTTHNIYKIMFVNGPIHLQTKGISELKDVCYLCEPFNPYSFRPDEKIEIKKYEYTIHKLIVSHERIWNDKSLIKYLYFYMLNGTEYKEEYNELLINNSQIFEKAQNDFNLNFDFYSFKDILPKKPKLKPKFKVNLPDYLFKM